MHTTFNARHTNPANAHAVSPILRRHLALAVPPSADEERALADAIVAVRRDAWVAALSDPARSPSALRSVLDDATARDDGLVRVADGLPFLQWADACARAARSRPASVARSYVPGMANVLAAVLADRSVDPADDALTAVVKELSAMIRSRRGGGLWSTPHASTARRHLATLADKVRDLAVRNLRLVVSMAHRSQRSRAGDESADALSVEDLIAHGVEGLERGIRGFDPALGYRLSTYAGPWIRAAINRAVANFGHQIRIPVGLAETMRKAVRTARELAASFGREPTPEEVAAAIGRPGPAGIAAVRRVLGGEVPRIAASLDQPLTGARGRVDAGGGNDLGRDVLSRIPSDAMNPEEALIAAEENVMAGQLLSDLGERERMVVALRYGVGEASGDETTLKEIADRLGVTRERTRQIHDRAVERMRRAADVVAVTT